MLAKRTFLFLVFLKSIALIAQDSPVPPIIPLTPNAASLGQFGNYSIGYHTGQPNISIPLYQIDYPSLSVPITLSYNYDGLKVEEYPSWVGLGWTLDAGGVITRQTRSLQDESNGGYNGPNSIGQQIKSYIAAGANKTDPAYASLLNGILNGLQDSEPDMFFFHFPGHSGRFFFDMEQCSTTVKTATVLPHQNLKIKGYFNYGYNANGKKGRIDKIEITDEKGVFYLFDELEEGVRENGDGGNQTDGFGNAWYLSTITDPKVSNTSASTIEFHYSPTDRVLYSPPTVSERAIMVYEQYVNKTYYYSTTSEKTLQKITFRNGSITFTEGANRLDWNYSRWTDNLQVPSEAQVPKVLDNVVVKVDNNIIKQFNFGYGYFGTFNARLRLDNLQETNAGISKPPYVFTYNEGATMPIIGNKYDLFSQDHWGYYTGGLQYTLIPSHTATLLTTGVDVIFTGNQRAPVPTAGAIGLLRRIDYPTGGNTNLEYEPHQYDGVDAVGYSPFNLCGGEFSVEATASVEMQRGLLGPENTLGEHSDIEVFGLSEDRCAKISYTLGNSGCIESSVSVHLVRINSSPDGNGAPLNQQYINVRQRIENNQDGNFVFASEGLFDPGETFTLPPGQYELQAFVEEVGGCNIPDIKKTKANISLLLASGSGGSGPGSTNRTAGGFRIKKMMDCAAGPCSGCITKYFDYKVPGTSTSSGKLLNVPGYFHEETFVFDGAQGNITSPQSVAVHVLESKSQIPMVSSNGASIGYEYVTVTEDQDGNNGKTIFHFTSPADYPDEGSILYPYPPLIDNGWKRGILKSRQDFARISTTDVLKQEQDVISGFNTQYNKYVGLKFAPKYIIDYQRYSINLSPKDYYFEPYSLKTGWIKTEDQTQIQFESGQQFTTHSVTHYDDATHLQPTSSELINTSKGETIVTTYKYPKDVGTLSGLTQAEIDGISANPNSTAVIEEIKSKNSLPLFSRRNLFNGINLTKVQTSTGSSSLEDQVNFTSYDAYGNILSYTTRSGEVHSYQYGYDHMYPVAEAINANPGDIYTESFEDGGTYMSNPANGNNLARSGIKVSGSGSFTFPASFQPTGPMMKMSYWFWDGLKWNFSGELPYTTAITSTGSKLDDVRAYPAGAIVTTYSYEPGKGVISVTDPNGITQFYEYDELGRLSVIRDNDGNVLKNTEYQYK